MHTQKPPKVYIQSVSNPEIRYEVIEFDPEKKRARLRGRYGEFPMEPFVKSKIIADGYKLVREKADGTTDSADQ